MYAIYSDYNKAKVFYDRINTGCGYPKNSTIEHTPIISYRDEWAIFLDKISSPYYENDADRTENEINLTEPE